ncbi:YkgJ family cysteine cluster protein [Pelotomaculum propionicicum]|uniref:YkgJ family cysteine cluster protein n=1 Tax=Pelotomaculum propionicicum TaxID=258475 RepID=A0A4Y7RUB3_9FIRM|nr:YkgJ family cysteine cluster protein [Pelotomaculum propionicicum]NLI12207.1 YkgJ family cysteine cluster protein [Peptococcaceae bacterium]TEB12565.1 hypothetical protein Pmgp_00896 [Pelotomaculum propionicicum]
MTQSETVRVVRYQFGEKHGYDLVITDNQATVQDYLNALNRAIEQSLFSCYRKNALPVCAGCGACCVDTVSLTRIDILNLREHLRVNQETLQQFLERGGYIQPGWRWVDFTLRKGEDGLCVFQDRESRLCSIHPARPLVCRLYTGCPCTRRADKVRNCIVRMAKHDLVSKWLTQDAEKGVTTAFHEGCQPRPKPNAFSGKKNYRQVLLKDLLPPELWRQIYVKG